VSLTAAPLAASVQELLEMVDAAEVTLYLSAATSNLFDCRNLLKVSPRTITPTHTHPHPRPPSWRSRGRPSLQARLNSCEFTTAMLFNTNAPYSPPTFLCQQTTTTTTTTSGARKIELIRVIWCLHVVAACGAAQVQEKTEQIDVGMQPTGLLSIQSKLYCTFSKRSLPLPRVTSGGREQLREAR